MQRFISIRSGQTVAAKRAGSGTEESALPTTFQSVLLEVHSGSREPLRSEECFFWATHAHAELDLLTFVGGKRVGFEFKAADAPTVTKSMRIALTDLHLDHLFVVFPGALEFPLEDRIDAIGFERLGDPKAAWRGKLPSSLRPGR